VRRAFITGICGQDGSYLAEFLLKKDYEVHGLVRRLGTSPPHHLKHLLTDPAAANQLFLYEGDLEDAALLCHNLTKSKPNEVYHLAGKTQVGLSYDQVEITCQTNAIGTLRLLEIVRHLPQPVRFFYASSSEIFGCPDMMPQDEQTPYRPVTPYGCAKAFATQMVSVYRRSFGMYGCSGILYNHESPRRGEHFVTQKICRAAAAISEGQQQELKLGNLTAQRDWGDARDFIRGMWQALQHPKPEDFVFATGELHSVEEVLEIAFATVNLDWRSYIHQDPKLLRLDEPTRLVGNPSKARRLLGWKCSTTFQQLIREMTLSACHWPRGL
jgi:GDPmannose 4,6-dehydratase